MKVLFLTLILASCSFGADYYVTNTGDDSADGTTEKSAWKTLSRIEKAELNPGDIVHLAAENIWYESLRLSRSGTTEKPIRILCEAPKESLALAKISGEDENGKPVRDYCIDIAASHISIEGLRITGAGNPERGAIMIWADQDRSDITIKDCVIEKNHGRGIWVAGDKGKTVSNLSILQNAFNNNDGSPIQIAKMKGGIISKNVMSGNIRKVVDTWQAGVRLWSSDISDVEVSGNNIFAEDTGLKESQPMGIHVDEVGPNVVVKDNDIHGGGSGTIGILIENTQGVQIVNNTVGDVHTGIFCYRAGHDLLISRNTVHAKSLGIVLQGHLANGVDAGPEIVKNGLLFTKTGSNIISSLWIKMQH